MRKPPSPVRAEPAAASGKKDKPDKDKPNKDKNDEPDFGAPSDDVPWPLSPDGR